MTITVGDRLPEASFVRFGDNGPETVAGKDIFAGRRVALFAVPGAFTPTCSNAHVPSFVKAAGALAEKGVDEIVCLSVNDPFVLDAWGKSTGATEAGIAMLGDPEAAFTKAIGMDFTAPPAGLINRSRRYSMLVEDGVVKVFNLEDSPGETLCSLGNTLVDQI